MYDLNVYVNQPLGSQVAQRIHHFPLSGDLPNPGIELGSLRSPALGGRFFTTRATWEAL